MIYYRIGKLSVKDKILNVFQMYGLWCIFLFHSSTAFKNVDTIFSS